jgi:hypothetical protein
MNGRLPVLFAQLQELMRRESDSLRAGNDVPSYQAIQHCKDLEREIDAVFEEILSTKYPAKTQVLSFTPPRNRS